MFFIHKKYIQQVWETITGCCYKTRTRCCKNCFQKVLHKTAEAIGELIGNKIDEKIMKSKSVIDENSRNVEKNRYSTRKITRNIKQIKTSIIKWSTIKYLNY